MGSSNHKLSFVHSYLHFFRQITEEFGDANHTQDHWGVVINAKPRKIRRICVRVKLAENTGDDSTATPAAAWQSTTNRIHV